MEFIEDHQVTAAILTRGSLPAVGGAIGFHKDDHNIHNAVRSFDYYFLEVGEDKKTGFVVLGVAWADA